MKQILKYLFFLVLGIILFIIYNSVDNFSVGIPYLTSDVIQTCAALMDSSIQPERQQDEVLRIQLWKKTALSWDQRWFLLFNDRIDYYQGRILRGTIRLSDILQISLVEDGDIGIDLSITTNTLREYRLWNGRFETRFSNNKIQQTNDERIMITDFFNILVLSQKIDDINRRYIRNVYDVSRSHYYTDIGLFTVLKKIKNLNRRITNTNVALVCGFSLEYYSDNFIDEDIIIFYDRDNKALNYARQCVNLRNELYPESTKQFLFVNLDLTDIDRINELFDFFVSTGFTLSLFNFTNIFEFAPGLLERNDQYGFSLSDEGILVLNTIVQHQCVSDNAFFIFSISQLTTIALNKHNTVRLSSSQSISTALIGREFYPLLQPDTAVDRFDKLLNHPEIYEQCAENYKVKIANIRDSQFQLHMNQFILCRTQPHITVEIFQRSTEYLNSKYWTWRNSDRTTNIPISNELREINALVLRFNEEYNNPDYLNTLLFENLSD